MDLGFMNEYVVLVVLGICICVGYIIKESLDFIPNKYIPLVMGILGVVTNVAINHGVDAEIILGGLASGLASTGLFEIYKNLIKKQ